MRSVGIQRFRFGSKKPPWVLAWNVLFSAMVDMWGIPLTIAHVKYQGRMKLNVVAYRRFETRFETAFQ